MKSTLNKPIRGLDIPNVGTSISLSSSSSVHLFQIRLVFWEFGRFFHHLKIPSQLDSCSVLSWENNHRPSSRFLLPFLIPSPTWFFVLFEESLEFFAGLSILVACKGDAFLPQWEDERALITLDMDKPSEEQNEKSRKRKEWKINSFFINSLSIQKY